MTRARLAEGEAEQAGKREDGRADSSRARRQTHERRWTLILIIVNFVNLLRATIIVLATILNIVIQMRRNADGVMNQKVMISWLVGWGSSFVS